MSKDNKIKKLDTQNIEIGKRINFIRKTKNWSKKELSNLLNITDQHLGKAIRGEVGLSVGKIIELSKISGFSTEFILLGNNKSVDKDITELIEVILYHSEISCNAVKRLSVLLGDIKNL